MDDLFGVTELVKEKLHGDEEAHHVAHEIKESTTTPTASVPANPSSATGSDKATHSHIEDDEVRPVPS
jgi:hypothetical protein